MFTISSNCLHNLVYSHSSIVLSRVWVWVTIYGFGLKIGLTGLFIEARDYILQFAITHNIIHSHVFISRCSVAGSTGGPSPFSGYLNNPEPRLPASLCNWVTPSADVPLSLGTWTIPSLSYQLLFVTDSLQRRTFAFLWVPEQSRASATSFPL
jgi:hypothetical protein